MENEYIIVSNPVFCTYFKTSSFDTETLNNVQDFFKVITKSNLKKPFGKNQS